VKFDRHTITKKTSSVLLIALMLFINAVKLLHTHPGIPRNASFDKVSFLSIPINIGKQQIKQNDYCSICDFQLVRDADVSHITIVIPAHLQVAIVNVAHLPSCLLTFPIACSGRAPPVFV
jgi:hypothetical protein